MSVKNGPITTKFGKLNQMVTGENDLTKIQISKFNTADGRYAEKHRFWR